MTQHLSIQEIDLERARALRRSLAEAYDRGDLAAALACSRALDALQLSLWQEEEARQAAS